MSSVTQTSKVTINTVLGTIQSLALATQQSINSATAGLDMIDTYVSAARQKQADRTKIDLGVYRDNLLKEAAIEQSRKDEAITKELKSNPELAQHFDTNYKKLAALFD